MTDTNIHPSEQILQYSEALATWTTRYLDPNGFECVLSLQAETGSEVLQKAESALSHLSEAKCHPLNNGNERGNGHKAEPTIMVKSDGKNPTCPIHNVEMAKWSKGDRTWYSHRWNDGWCNGKKS